MSKYLLNNHYSYINLENNMKSFFKRYIYQELKGDIYEAK